MKAKLRGTEIYFDIAGMQLKPVGRDFIEQPVLFLLHGGPGGDHLRFKQHSLELQNFAQIVFIDHRGCGQSKKTKIADYTLENNIEDIEALRKHLGLNKICILGTSSGGMVAQGYAIRYPTHVEKLILAVTAPSFRFIADAKKNLVARANAKQIAICEYLWSGSFKSTAHVNKYLDLMEPLYSMTGKRKKPAIVAKFKTVWSYEALNKGFSGSLQHFDFIPKLHKITCPTLVLAGDNDWICPPNHSRMIAEKIPRAKLKVFKNCGHALAVDAHKGYVKIIGDFLKPKVRKN